MIGCGLIRPHLDCTAICFIIHKEKILVQKGFEVAQQLREEEKAKEEMRFPVTNPQPGARLSAADQLEMSLVAELALENFNAA